jgi:hypothetical protein
VEATAAAPPSSSRQHPGSGRGGRGAKQPRRYADAESDGEEDSPPAKAKGRKQKADSDFEVGGYVCIGRLCLVVSSSGALISLLSPTSGSRGTIGLASCRQTAVRPWLSQLAKDMTPGYSAKQSAPAAAKRVQCLPQVSDGDSSSEESEPDEPSSDFEAEEDSPPKRGKSGRGSKVRLLFDGPALDPSAG